MWIINMTSVFHFQASQLTTIDKKKKKNWRKNIRNPYPYHTNTIQQDHKPTASKPSWINTSLKQKGHVITLVNL